MNLNLCAQEVEMLRWISIMNQSVAAIVSTFNFRRVRGQDQFYRHTHRRTHTLVHRHALSV